MKKTFSGGTTRKHSALTKRWSMLHHRVRQSCLASLSPSLPLSSKRRAAYSWASFNLGRTPPQHRSIASSTRALLSHHGERDSSSSSSSGGDHSLLLLLPSLFALTLLGGGGTKQCQRAGADD